MDSDRYGTRPSRLRAAGAVFFVVLTAAVGWSAWRYAMTPIRTQVVSFESKENSMVVRYQVTRRDGSTPITCRVTAQNYQRRVVGEISDTIPAGLTVLTRIVEVPTLSKAAAGFVGQCQRR